MHLYEARGNTEKGSKVRFHVSDVFLPSPADLAVAFSGAEELEGTVIDFSDSGKTHHAFALIEVTRQQTVIIPTEKLEPVCNLETPPAGSY